VENKEPWVLEWATQIFQEIAVVYLNQQQDINLEHFKIFLRSISMTREEDLDFASNAFELMDMYKSGALDKDEFLYFATVTLTMEG
jgi:Ca2+-binding EF-hand superfamily protein